MADQERPQSVLPNSPAMEEGFRSATEAMQRAADAMIAATESFRMQFEHPDDALLARRPLTYHSYLDPDEANSYRQSGDSLRGPGRERAPSLLLPPSSSMAGSTAFATPNIMSASNSRPDTGETGNSGHLAPPNGSGGGGGSSGAATAADTNRTTTYPISTTPVPAHSPMADFLPKRPQVSRVNTGQSTSSFGARVVPGSGAPRASSEAIISMTPTADWPVASGSHPNLASTLALPPLLPPPSVKTGPGSSWGSGHAHRASAPAHIDLFEAASRLGRPYSYQGSFRRGPSPAMGDGVLGGTDYEDPSPVVQIGRYTYVRSDTDLETSLIGDGGRGGGRQQPPSQHQRYHDRGGRPQPPSPQREAGLVSLTHEILFILLICIAQALMLAGIAQGLVPARIIGQSFPDTGPGDLAWYSAAYGLTAGTFVLPSGRLGDLFGHKRVFIIGFVWFGAWSLAAGFAGHVQAAGSRGTVFFCFCRAMQGIGPALLVPNGQAMLGRTYRPGPRKNLVMCLFGAAAPFGFVVGAAMASLFATRASWPWAFWTLAAVCAALAAMSVVILPAPAPPAPTTATTTTTASTSTTQNNNNGRSESLWTRLDATGMLLGVSGLVLFNFAFNQAPIVSWTTPYTYFLLIIGLMLLAAFCYVEVAAAAHPLVPIAAMRPTTNFVLGCTAAGWGCFSIWVYYSFAVIEDLRGWDPLHASAGYAHGPLAGLAASLLTGYLLSRQVKPHWIMLVSMCAFFLGSALFATAPVGQSYWINTFLSILVMPFGMDMSNPAATILLSDSVGREHQGIAASLVVTVVNYSISLALGIAGTVQMNLDPLGADPLRGIRGAQYFGLGLGGLGIALAAAFLLRSYYVRGGGASQPSTMQEPKAR